MVSSSVDITVMCVIYGWPTTKSPTTARIVDFVVSAELKISNIATTVVCASTKVCILTITARVGNTSPTAPSARNFSLVPEAHHMKCPVDMPFTGNAFVNWQRMTHDVLFVRKRPRPGSE